ncbi:MAG TPA: hypothetical protein VGS41_00555 [Chthonomonadales bacterium]|nr:hypothetical protein [Chthonomonadales bacterium]
MGTGRAEAAGAREAAGAAAQVAGNTEETHGTAPHSYVGTVCQTMQTSAAFAAIAGELSLLTPQGCALNSLCGAPGSLRGAAATLAEQVHLVVAADDNNGANSRRVRQVCAESGKRAHLVESAA